MSRRVAVVITEDPCETHRPVEALRIALGFSAGDHDTTVVLLGRAPLLLTNDIDNIVDVDILEKYLPTLKQLDMPFVLEKGTVKDPPARGFIAVEQSQDEIRQLLQSVDRSVVF